MTAPPDDETHDSFLVKRPVSRETLDRLVAFADRLARWNDAINLVSRSTLTQVWTRHILDSAQIFDVALRDGPVVGKWLDLGAGGGFPGLVCAILARDEAPGLHFTLVESDRRKAAFLEIAARDLKLDVTVVAARAEVIAPARADILTARALAALPALLMHAARHLAPDGRAFFPKGAGYAAEVANALADWRFSLQEHRSRTDPAAVILEIQGLSRV
jgi:16S rRNA (guanine527-N7)-methyltransferase